MAALAADAAEEGRDQRRRGGGRRRLGVAAEFGGVAGHPQVDDLARHERHPDAVADVGLAGLGPEAGEEFAAGGRVGSQRSEERPDHGG